MPMMLLIETDCGISEFVMKPIDRKTRQTMTKRLAVDSQGRECSRAMLTHDGLLLQSGAVADLYEDGDGNSIEHGEVIQTDESGNVLRNLAATVGRPQRPVGPIPPEEMLEHVIVKAYALTPIAIARDLRDSLIGGDIYRVAYRPRVSVTDNPAFILANTSGIFLLQCKTCLIEFIRLDQPIVLEDEMEDAHHQQSMVAQLLALLDGLESRNGIFVLATTNRPKAIDSALRRPGRFDRVVWMKPPDEAGRSAILRHYFKPLKMDYSIDVDALACDLASATGGASGADLEYICQTAARLCVKEALSCGMLPDDVRISAHHFDLALSSLGYAAIDSVRESQRLPEAGGGRPSHIRSSTTAG